MRFVQTIPLLAILSLQPVTSSVIKRDDQEIGLKFEIKFKEHTSIQLHGPGGGAKEGLLKGGDDEKKEFSWKKGEIGATNANSKQWFEYKIYGDDDVELLETFDCSLQALKVSDEVDNYTLGSTAPYLSSFRKEDTARLRCGYPGANPDEYKAINSDTLW